MTFDSILTRFGLCLAGAVVATAAGAPVWAADPFPNKEIRFIVPWNAAGKAQAKSGENGVKRHE